MKKKKAMMIGIEGETEETIKLALSLGYEIIEEITQKRKYPDRTTYLGSGKIEEVSEKVSEMPSDVSILVGGDVTPRQHYKIESKMGRPIKDRIGLILEAFQKSAQGQVAKLEVKLAQLKYEVPFLREWVHSSTSSERAGFYGGGAQRIDVYLDQIDKEMNSIEEALEKTGGKKRQWLKRRQEKGYFQISFSGYTNSGKTTLFNIMTGENEEESDGYFTTLNTKTSNMEDNKWGPVLFSDTVGFFSNLPPWMLSAFESTLEEIFNANGIMMMVNGNQDLEGIFEEAENSIAILSDEVEANNIQPIINKTDTINEKDLEKIMVELNDMTHGKALKWRAISCRDNNVKNTVKRMILDNWFPNQISFRILSNQGLKYLGKMEMLGILLESDLHSTEKKNHEKYLKNAKDPNVFSYRVPDKNIDQVKEVLSKGEVDKLIEII